MRRWGWLSLLLLLTPSVWAQETPMPTLPAVLATTAPGPVDVSTVPDPRAIRCRDAADADAFLWHLEEGARRRGREQMFEAYQHYNCAVKLNPNVWVAYRGRAITLSAQNNFQGALADLDVALDLNPKEPTLFYWRGVVLSQMSENEAALGYLNRAIELDPGYGAAFNWRGIVHRNLGQYNNAIQDFNIAIEIGMPDNPQSPYMNLGNLYNDHFEDPLQALTWYQQAARVAPERGYIQEVLGDTYLALGLFSEAEASYAQYIALENRAKEEVRSLVEAARLRQNLLRFAPSLLIIAIIGYFGLAALWRRLRPARPAPAPALTMLTASTPLPAVASPTAAAPPAPSQRPGWLAWALLPLLAAAAYVLRRLTAPIDEDASAV